MVLSTLHPIKVFLKMLDGKDPFKFYLFILAWCEGKGPATQSPLLCHCTSTTLLLVLWMSLHFETITDAFKEKSFLWKTKCLCFFFFLKIFIRDPEFLNIPILKQPEHSDQGLVFLNKIKKEQDASKRTRRN